MKTLKEITDQFAVPLVPDHGSISEDFQSFLESVKDETGIEGYILLFADGRSYKIKTEEYVLLHRAQSALLQEKDVWRLVASGSADDLKPLLQDEDRELLEQFESKFYAQVDNLVDMISNFVLPAKARIENEIKSDMFEDAEGMQKKEFAVNYATTIDPVFRGAAFKAFDGQDIRESVMALVMANTSTNPKIEKFRKHMNGLTWDRLAAIE